MDRVYHLLSWTSNTWNCDSWDWFINIFKKTVSTGKGEVLPKKMENFGLILSWYSEKGTKCGSLMVSKGFLNVLKPTLSPTSMHITLKWSKSVWYRNPRTDLFFLSRLKTKTAANANYISGWFYSGRRYWIWTSDFYRVKVALSRWVNRPLLWLIDIFL